MTAVLHAWIAGLTCVFSALEGDFNAYVEVGRYMTIHLTDILNGLKAFMHYPVNGASRSHRLTA